MSKSYLKSTVACLALVLIAVSLTFASCRWLPGPVGGLGAALFALVSLCAATIAGAGVVVLARYRRSTRGDVDLFLHLNRSREPAAIAAAAACRSSPVRRWLARRLLGHDLLVGDAVEIRSWPEIRATLDGQGCLEELPFMPEMLAMCGQRAVVFRCMHRLFDYRKSRRMRHMDGAVLLVGAVCDGSSHGGCEAACHTIWKAAWLRRAGAREAAPAAPPSTGPADRAADLGVPDFGVTPPNYACQLTQLHAASRPLRRWSITRFFLPLISGNVTLSAFSVGWLTHLFNDLQHYRQGVSFPAFEPVPADGASPEAADLKAEDTVFVRPSGEIRATLNDQFLHRGLWLEPDMLKHCGGRYRVQAEVRKLIDIVTGEMRTMKTPAYTLRGVHFSGERQLFNAQYEPLFWRSIWLRRAEDTPESAISRHAG